MGQSPQEQIEMIVRSLEEQGKAAAPIVEATDLAVSHPEAVVDLAIAVMQRFPKGGTFLDAALSYLPEENWSQLIQVALEKCEESSGNCDAAESVIAYASLQAPAILHSHLSHIFTVQPNAGCYYEKYPWRESGEQHFDYLRNVFCDTSSSEGARKRAWLTMLESRHPKMLEFALSHTNLISPPDTNCLQDEWIQAHLHLIGFHQDNKTLHRTCRDVLYHIQFPNSYFEDQSRPPWLARIHPTWKLNSSMSPISFGGRSDGHCSLCGGSLHRLITLDPIPQGLGIVGLARLELVTCLSCLGWEQQPLFYQHDQNGFPVNVGYDGTVVKPEFPVGPLKSGEVRLAETPHRWYWQDWALSNSRENLNRVGGEPCWIQDAEYPNCPNCQRLMPYLMQLDSDLTTEDGGEWLWGSGGIGYVFWCDVCKISGVLWQCT